MIEKIIIISPIVFAIWYSYQEGEIFEFVSKWLGKKLPEKLHAPAFECVVCMTPLYGTVVYHILPLLPQWIPIVIAAMGVNAILNKMFPSDKIEIKEPVEIKKADNE